MVVLPGITFASVLFTFQLLLLGLYAGFVNYTDNINSPVVDSRYYYPLFQDVHVMIFVGIGLLTTFLKKYGYCAVSYNILLGSVSVQWGILLNAWIKQRVTKEEHGFPSDAGQIYVGIKEIMAADFCAATVLISYCAVLGKASRLQLLLMAIIEPIFFAINETVLVEYLHITDIGGTITVHLFAAYFGLGVASVLQNSGDEHENEASVYHSDLFSMIGTLFLWAFWPSFNAALIGNDPDRQNRAILNTYFSLAGGVCTTAIVSSLVTKKFKLSMVHIQNATLAGGVAVGASADLMIKPWGAILIGMTAGVICTLGFTYVSPFLNRRMKIHDTCGVNNLHGLPGIFGGIVGAIVVASIKQEDYYNQNDYKTIYPKVFSGERSRSKQAWYQLAAVCTTFAISLASGLITGVIIKYLDGLEEDELYDDEKEFELPEEKRFVERKEIGTSNAAVKTTQFT